ncbi:LuxR C-terminal-related transcriptional regulator [Pseudomonas sp. FP2196]|uniref:LuxR C-terminal-related transcriptional regulator n=1 Tax=Pseudomonas sp. FP2196 TaxID=2954086 RepID=UPI0027340CBF|nr:LuxR C-terminal-related transcriptional regulator [Pseudomonas sp. FP2196]WLH36590.1 LuxR C-terminal-related transcriptional regulator [Pseudomonas sp. FP2196]
MTAMTPCLDRPGFLPRLSAHHQPRARLNGPLLESMARVRLICAPAGSGKSALLAECLLQAPPRCEVGWLPLAGAALSTSEFCLRLAQALGLAETTESALVTELSRWSRPTWLFIDDYCRLPDPALDALLDRLLTVSSPACVWWIGTRRRPQCNWPRLLLDDELYECESPTLALTQAEIAQALKHLPAEQASDLSARIYQRTAGWCAGVRMALLRKCDWSQTTESQQRVDTLLDYLQHELFSGLTPELTEVWRVLAQMPRFNAQLCEHLFGVGEGAIHLRTLQLLGCFIEPWNESADWLQIFPPLSRVVREEHWPSRRTWHRRACQWFSAAQDWRSAFEQALLAEEFEAAISLLQHFSFEQLFEEQTVVLLLRLHEQQSEELTLSTPQLVGLITAALLFAGRFEQAAKCIGHLGRFMPQPSPALEGELISRWQTLQGWLLHLEGRMEAAHECFSQALEVLDSENWIARVMCLSGLTQQALLRGELDLAQALNRQALCLARAHGSLVFEALLELDHGQLLEQRGAAPRAESLLAGVHDLLARQPNRLSPLLGRIALRRGRLALSQGLDASAAAFFQSGLDDCKRNQDKRVLYGYLGLAQLAANEADYQKAFLWLRDAERLMQQRQIPETVYRGVLLQVSSLFWLQQGRPELVCEAMTRLLRHYQGSAALQAPPATLELIPRVECLLVLAQVGLGAARNPIGRLQLLLEAAQRCRMLSLETDLHLALAEVAFFQGDQASALGYLHRGLELAIQHGLHQAQRELRMRRPDMAQLLDNKVTEPSCAEALSGSGLLSQRELEVLRLIAKGCSNQQVADQLFISIHTVKTHARRIHGKLGVERRTQAVANAKLLGFSL